MGDNLDDLSNAELRAQMQAQGLPNIPVTDSSRKVLVKRLRASLGGNAGLPAASASPKKTGNKRETLQPAVAVSDKVDAASAAQDANIYKSRRSVATAAAAATPSDIKEAERRRQALQKPETTSALPRVPEATAEAKPVASTSSAAAPAAKSAPTKTRRSSAAAERQELVSERVLKKPETIVEETVPSQSKNTLLVNSLIILESDDEEDEQLAQAAQNAEDQYKDKQMSARPTLSRTSTRTHEYISKPLYQPQPEPQTAVLEPRLKPRQKPLYEPIIHSEAASSSTASVNPLQQARYNSYVSAYAQGYNYAPTVASTSAAAGGSRYRSTPPLTYTNEFSDDAEEDVARAPAAGLKYESDFARNLERLRAERIGDRRYNRGSIASGTGYDPGVRRPLRAQDSLFPRWWQNLDRKYQLAPKLFFAFVLLLLFCVYKMYY